MDMKTSIEIAEIATALAQFNSKMKTVPRSAYNTFFKNYKYSTLDDVYEGIRPTLAECGLSLLQPATFVDGRAVVSTILLHKSGQWLQSEPLKLKPKEDSPQAVGSAISYAKRYAAVSLLCIATGDDDDAETAMGRDGIKDAPQAKSISKSYQVSDALQETNSSGKVESFDSKDPKQLKWLMDQLEEKVSNEKNEHSRIIEKMEGCPRGILKKTLQEVIDSMFKEDVMDKTF